MRLIRVAHIKRRLAREDGFTMLFALLALMVGTLLVAAAFTSANGDIKLTQRSTVEAKAYYAAVAGVDRYQYQLTNSPEYWTKCPSITNLEGGSVKVPGTTDESYTVKTLASSTSKKTACESGKQATILETKAPASGTFRILSTGTATEGANTVTRKIVATFSHPGFTKYVYESNFEVEDPVNFGKSASVCEFYYAERVKKNLTNTCPVIQFAPTDEVNGPMHTNDAAATCTSGGNSPKFGREGYNDEIAMNGGHYAPSGCSNSPNIVGTYTESAGSILPPPTDQEILEAAELRYEGRTELELKTGSPNTMAVTKPGQATKVVNFPSNGVLYVENSKSEACAITNYTPFNADTETDTGCGNVYVHGEYTESLTIASADDVIVNGNLTTTHEPNGEPTGGATLGLIAENFVRVYHPVTKEYEVEHKFPPSEEPRKGKCITEKSVGGKVLESTEVSEIATTGLFKGDEVEGPGIQGGTVISSVGTNKITLSKAAKPKKELSAKLTNNSTEVKEINTTGLVVGAEVEGTAAQIEEGTKITEVKASAIKLSKAAKTNPKPVSGTIHKTTEVTGISTTGLTSGMEVQAPNGQIAAGTTISSTGTNKIILSSAAKPLAKEFTGTLKSGKKEVTSVNTTGLAAGQEIEGSGIAANTTIESVSTSKNEIKLSKNATENRTNSTLKAYATEETLTLKIYPKEETTTLTIIGETAQLTFLHSTGYALNPSFEGGICHKVESNGQEYRETENVYIASCEEGSYRGKLFCEYENTSSKCANKVENMTAAEDPNHWGALKDPVIDAAILSTNHSWIVDNYKCGNALGKLTVWGSIAQFWRGPVGQAGGAGYIKNYNYDNRLANQQPPSFLSPTNASSWKISRETAPPTGFTG